MKNFQYLFSRLLAIMVLCISFGCAMDVPPRITIAQQEELRQREMQKLLVEQASLIGALTRRMDEFGHIQDRFNDKFMQLARRIEELETEIRRITRLQR